MRLRTTLTVLACGLALTACGGNTTPGTPTATPTPSSTGVALPYGGAPDITNPLDGTPLVKDQCSAMTTAEAEQTLGGTLKNATPNAGTTAGSGAEYGCNFNLANGLGGVVAGPSVNEPYGLSGTYKGNQSVVAGGGKPIFRELAPVEGYPTIQSTEGYEGDGVCIVFTGLSNSQLYIVKVELGLRNPHYADPCGLGEQVAALAIKKLKGA